MCHLKSIAFLHFQNKVVVKVRKSLGKLLNTGVENFNNAYQALEGKNIQFVLLRCYIYILKHNRNKLFHILFVEIRFQRLKTHKITYIRKN
jgi:hypothetical protein